jgi:hypothetical protein
MNTVEEASSMNALATSSILLSVRDIPSNLLGDLPYESRALGQETFPPRYPSDRLTDGDLYSSGAVRG